MHTPAAPRALKQLKPLLDYKDKAKMLGGLYSGRGAGGKLGAVPPPEPSPLAPLPSPPTLPHRERGDQKPRFPNLLSP